MEKLNGNKINTAVFISGRGSNLKYLIKNSNSKKSLFKICLVISSNPKAIGLKYVLDGLQVAGVLPEDNMDWIIGFIHTFQIDKENPRLEVLLQPEPEGI